MPVDRALKVLGALLLLVALALPLSTCTHHVDAQGKSLDLVSRDEWPEDAKEVVRYRYVLSGLYPLEGQDYWTSVRATDLTLLLAFIWPVLALAVLHRKPLGPVAIAVRGLEVILVPASIGLINFSASFLTTRAIGAYWAYCALGVYAIGAIWSDLTLYKGWRRERRTSGLAG